MTAPPPGFRYIDMHTHLHPDWLFRAIRRWFAERSTWRIEQPTEPERVAAALHERGVARFAFFSYAHKAGIARGINRWLHETARRLPAGIPLGTVHPDDPDVLDTAAEALEEYGFRGFKFHINVQRFFPDDPRVLPVYERLQAGGGFVVMHVGSAPWPNRFDGFANFERLMRRYPELTVVVAHMGSWETRDFLSLMERCPNLHLDTTMAFAPLRPEHRAHSTINRIEVSNDDLIRWQDRILFGSDFPNLFYPYEDEQDALWVRDLPMSVYRKIFHDNAARLLELG